MNVNWTSANTPDLTGKIIIVTEGSNSIGFEAVKTFSAKGATTIMACHDLTIGEKAKKMILDQHPKANIELMALDISDMKSMNLFVEAFRSKFERLDVLLHNAANVSIQTKGKDGNVSQLAHFTLTGLLLPSLTKAHNSRVVTLSEGENKIHAKDFSKLLAGTAHGNSSKAMGFKMANMLFTYELQKRFDKEGVNCIAVAAYPGTHNKNHERKLENSLSWKLFKPFFSMFGGANASVEAIPAIRASVAKDVKGGEYYGPNGFVEVKGYPSYSTLEQLVA